MLVPSGSQTAGPFFSFALHHEHWNDLVAKGPRGEKIHISGRLIDGDGAPVPDGFIEIRQADAAGTYTCDERFTGFGRCTTDDGGNYSFATIRPGRVGTRLGLQAPHVAVQVFSRGLLRQLFTRMYFADRPVENADDPLLVSIAPVRRETLIAKRVESANGVPEFRFDIVLQGEGETAFFEP